jgi:hypothetical protein
LLLLLLLQGNFDERFNSSEFWNQNYVLCVFFKGRHCKGQENLQVELVIFQSDAVLTGSFLKRNCKRFIHAAPRLPNEKLSVL